MQKVIVVIGPTASGKSRVAVEIALKINSEVISGDSIQVYRSLDIGSAKIKDNEMKGIKHHLIDIKDPTENYSVYDFQKESRKLIDDISKRGMIPIISGGTGFYIKAALYDYNFSIDSRTDEYDNLSNEELYERLKELGDKELPDKENRKRLLRHMELYSSGDDISYNKDKPLYDILLIGLTEDRNILYERINKRVDQMVKDGLLDEVKSLYDKGIRSNAINSIGYKEIYSYLDGEISLDMAINKIKQHTRNFAKRQYTWFNNQMNTKWFDISSDDYLDKILNEVEEFIK